MSVLEEVHAQADATISAIGEAAAMLTETKSIADEHIAMSSGVGSEFQVNGGQALASGIDEALADLATGLNLAEKVQLEATLAQQ